MDRSISWRSIWTTGFPRMRGDGPRHHDSVQSFAQFPPHARGWTPDAPGMVLSPEVSPACAGMDRISRRLIVAVCGFPRMRGDGPVGRDQGGRRRAFPPHARGWTQGHVPDVRERAVSPACAGMDPMRAQRIPDATGFPRMRGDGPIAEWTLRIQGLFPPHARGWTCTILEVVPTCVVSPACAGMDRFWTTTGIGFPSFPRMRGDGPLDALYHWNDVQFPPHARGWTHFSRGELGFIWVSPACAGMDLNQANTSRFAKSFPRMRGDGPRPRADAALHHQFPPHARDGPTRPRRSAAP